MKAIVLAILTALSFARAAHAEPVNTGDSDLIHETITGQEASAALDNLDRADNLTARLYRSLLKEAGVTDLASRADLRVVKTTYKLIQADSHHFYIRLAHPGQAELSSIAAEHLEVHYGGSLIRLGAFRVDSNEITSFPTPNPGYSDFPRERVEGAEAQRVLDGLDQTSQPTGLLFLALKRLAAQSDIMNLNYYSVYKSTANGRPVYSIDIRIDEGGDTEMAELSVHDIELQDDGSARLGYFDVRALNKMRPAPGVNLGNR